MGDAERRKVGDGLREVTARTDGCMVRARRGVKRCSQCCSSRPFFWPSIQRPLRDDRFGSTFAVCVNVWKRPAMSSRSVLWP
jgi:hypothetical protein